MKVLFLPFNIASMQAITAEALNKIEGVEARCINIKLNKYNSDNDAVVFLEQPTFKRSSPLSSLSRDWKYRREIRRWIRWADVLHYVWGPVFDNGWDVTLAMKMNKPIFIEWVGSDIRNPELLSRINKYYGRVLNEGYEYRDIEAGDYKERVQSLFSKAGAIPTLMPEMSLFLDKSKFHSHIELPHRINLDQYKPAYPDTNTKKPHIIHSPSVKVGKGSNVIIKVIEELRRDYEFDFTLVHNMEREEALKVMRHADIFIDQIIVGGYGMAGCEAMAYGKPVVNFIVPEVFDAGLPVNCPIVNANPDTLKHELIRLISDPLLRNEIGKRSRVFVETYNDANSIASRLIEIYKTAIKKSQALA